MIVFKELGRYGRFANGLFQIASTIGIAIKNNQPFAFPKFINYDHKERFGSSEDIECYKFFENQLPEIPPGLRFEDRFIQWGFHDVRLNRGNYNLIGHMQSEKYFKHYIGEVRRWLKMKDEYPQSDYCAIHYRAGDYQDDPNAYHPRMPESYYEQAVKHFPLATRFVIFSDDKDAAYKMIKKHVQFVHVISDHYADDFKLMKSCKDFIISNSSYSAMAAILANHPEKKVVSPSGYNWFGDVAGINGNDIVSDDWVQIKFDKRKVA